MLGTALALYSALSFIAMWDTRMKHTNLLSSLVAVGALTLALLPLTGQAQSTSLVLNGKAIHLNSARDWNEANWGLGIEREFDSYSRWVKVAMANGFLDSQDNASYMVGGGIKRRFRFPGVSESFHVDFGAVGFLMSRADVNNRAPFPGILPAMTVGTKRVALNVTYLPRTWADKATSITKVDPTVSGIVFLQLKLDASLLGFGGKNGRGLLASTD